MRTTSFKGSKFNLKSISPAQAQEFQCHSQKSSGICAIETQKWPLHYQKEKCDAVEFATSLKMAWWYFKATNGWTVIYMYCKGLLLRSKTTLVHRLPYRINSMPVAYNYTAPQTQLHLRTNGQYR